MTACDQDYLYIIQYSSEAYKMSRQFPASSRQFPASSRQFPASSRQFPASSRQFPACSRQFHSSSRQFSSSSRQFPASSRQFPASSCWVWTSPTQRSMVAYSPPSHPHLSPPLRRSLRIGVVWRGRAAPRVGASSTTG